MKVIIYSRVSTDDKGQDPEWQAMKCRQYVELHEHTVIADLRDEITGTLPFSERPGGKEAHELLSKGKAEGLIVFSVDRYSRESPIKVLQEIERYSDMGVTFVSVSEPIFNMDSELSGPMKYLLTWFSNYFIKQHKVKVKAGMERARKRGSRIGRPTIKYPIHKILRMRADGKSYRDISKETCIPLTSIRRVCQKGAPEKSGIVNKESSEP